MSQQQAPTGVRSLPVELHIMILSYLSYLDHIACEAVLPVWYDLVTDPATFSRRYTRSKLRYTMTHPDERYLIHGLIRDCYFFVHSVPESKRAVENPGSMTVTIIPITSVSSNEADQYPSNLYFLDKNQFGSRLISSIPGAMTFTDPPFLDDAVWCDARGLSPEEEPECDIWFYPIGCSHRLPSIVTTVHGFTIRNMLSRCISNAKKASEIMANGCSKCWNARKDKSAEQLANDFNLQPVYIRRAHLRGWTYRNPSKDWMGMFAFERYFVNVQDLDDGEICGKIVKPWHWTSFWNQIIYDGDSWVPTSEGTSCIIFGVDDLKHKQNVVEGTREGYFWWRGRTRTGE
ncbi:hypothetical protein TWF730_006262 [Orbilia blumenaviensis]|uniref:F-box domain-containing protein n=1 Tax=Orbilia blumenaviensis TaxID=1796055 RepID=A0AAV9VG29_9PEZI